MDPLSLPASPRLPPTPPPSPHEDQRETGNPTLHSSPTPPSPTSLSLERLSDAERLQTQRRREAEQI